MAIPYRRFFAFPLVVFLTLEFVFVRFVIRDLLPAFAGVFAAGFVSVGVRVASANDALISSSPGRLPSRKTNT